MEPKFLTIVSKTDPSIGLSIEVNREGKIIINTDGDIEICYEDWINAKQIT